MGAVPPIAVVLGWVLLFGSSLLDHVASSRNPRLFNDDVRSQIWPFFRYYDGPARWTHDMIGDYFLSAYLPAGYKALMAPLAHLVDPATTSKALPYVLLAAVIVLCADASRRLAGWSAAFGTGALVLSSGFMLDHMGGGLPRAFGSPVLALALWASASGHPLALAAAVVLGAAFYPVAATAPGLALGLWFLALPKNDQGAAARWSLGRRTVLLVATALLAVILFLPQAFGGRAFGRMIGPDDVATYPEAGPGGRYVRGDQPPFGTLFDRSIGTVASTLHGNGAAFVAPLRDWARNNGWYDRRIVAALAAFMLAGSVVLALRNPAGRRMLLLVPAAAAGFVIAGAVAPRFYLPPRHLIYAVSVLTVTLLPVACFTLGRLLPGRWGGLAAPLLAIAITGATLLLLGGQVPPRAGLTVELSASDRLYSFLASLPDDALVAGWPDGPVDNVPYASRRPVLLSFETHLAFHEAYADEMRMRTRAVVAAMFTTDLEPLIALRERFGVTHLIVDKGHLGAGAPTYFQPFTDEVRAAHARGLAKGFTLLSLSPEARVFEQATLFVVDLTQITSDSSMHLDSALPARRMTRRDPNAAWRFQAGGDLQGERRVPVPDLPGVLAGLDGTPGDRTHISGVRLLQGARRPRGGHDLEADRRLLSGHLVHPIDPLSQGRISRRIACSRKAR